MIRALIALALFVSSPSATPPVQSTEDFPFAGSRAKLEAMRAARHEITDERRLLLLREVDVRTGRFQAVNEFEDAAAAAEYYHDVSERGLPNPYVLMSLGWARMFHDPPPEDPVARARWHYGSRAQSDSQYLLGAAYWTGDGVPRDLVRAHMWMNISVATGRRSASRVLNAIEEDMTAPQIERATRLAHGCMSSGYRDCPSP